MPLKVTRTLSQRRAGTPFRAILSLVRGILAPETGHYQEPVAEQRSIESYSQEDDNIFSGTQTHGDDLSAESVRLIPTFTFRYRCRRATLPLIVGPPPN